VNELGKLADESWARYAAAVPTAPWRTGEVSRIAYKDGFMEGFLTAGELEKAAKHSGRWVTRKSLRGYDYDVWETEDNARQCWQDVDRRGVMETLHAQDSESSDYTK